MIFLGKNSLVELKNAVVDSVKSALNSLRNDEEQAVTLTQTINDLKKQLRTTKDELDDVKSKKKIELLEIEHLVKMKEEKNSIQLEKKVIELQKQFNDKEMVLLKGHHEKTLSMIEDTKKEFNSLYREILSRLPNINATLDMNVSKKVSK